MSDDFSNQSGSDSLTVYTSQSWFGRLGGALVGLVIGLLLVPGAIWLIAWNEGRAVSTARSLAEGSGAVVEASASRIDPGQQGRLVHLTGRLDVPGALSDAEFGVVAPGAAKLVRRVEMFQWQETESSQTRNKLGGGSETATTYHYARGWSDRPIDSAKFNQPNGHANPPFRVRSGGKVAVEGHIGAFRLDATVLGKLGPEEKLPLETPPPAGQLADGGVYLGADPQNPALGDSRIHYLQVHPSTASIIAEQDGSGLRPFTTRNGRTLLLAEGGDVPAAAMFKEAERENTLIAWALRAVGALVLLLGFGLLLNPLAVLASVVPMLGDMVGLGIGLVALLLTIIVAPLIIAISWLAVRPLVGGAILAAAAVGAAIVIRAIHMRRTRFGRTSARTS